MKFDATTTTLRAINDSNGYNINNGDTYRIDDGYQ